MIIKHSTDILSDTVRNDGDIGANVYRIKDTGTADTDYQFNHGLGRVPVGCQIILKNKTCDVYKGSEWNEQVVYLKFTASNADVNIRIW